MHSFNSHIRLYKYTPGQHFGQHYDDSVRDPLTGAKSEWTLLVYVTGVEDGVKGGEVCSLTVGLELFDVWIHIRSLFFESVDHLLPDSTRQANQRHYSTVDTRNGFTAPVSRSSECTLALEVVTRLSVMVSNVCSTKGPQSLRASNMFYVRTLCSWISFPFS